MSTQSPEGDRIAKVLSRAGVASRREAERMIADGRVRVNSKVIDSPALNVTANDRISVDGKLIAEAEHARLWLYHKPAGLVTSASDEKGRTTVFDSLPEDMPRVMSIGRLDLNSEGLLLLTNDGALKRRLELPSTGWLRKYRVRINGSVSEAKLDQLRQGITVDGMDYQPMQVTFDRQQGANAWLTIALREGKNREIRRAMEALDVVVNRLLRVSYGPFQLGNLAEGAVEEVKRRVLRDQLGMDPDAEQPAEPKLKPVRTRKQTQTAAASDTGAPVKYQPPKSPGARANRVAAAKPAAAKPAAAKAAPQKPASFKAAPRPKRSEMGKPHSPSGKKRG